jgi:predicted DNA-binding transcriptional regulator AlpA
MVHQCSSPCRQLLTLPGSPGTLRRLTFPNQGCYTSCRCRMFFCVTVVGHSQIWSARTRHSSNPEIPPFSRRTIKCLARSAAYFLADAAERLIETEATSSSSLRSYAIVFLEGLHVSNIPPKKVVGRRLIAPPITSLTHSPRSIPDLRVNKKRVRDLRLLNVSRPADFNLKYVAGGGATSRSADQVTQADLISPLDKQGQQQKAKSALAPRKKTPRATTKPSEIPHALVTFDLLPASGFVRLPVVAGLLGCSGATVWRRVKAGSLPQPRKLSPRITAWNVGELRQVLALHHAAQA